MSEPRALTTAPGTYAEALKLLPLEASPGGVHVLGIMASKGRGNGQGNSSIGWTVYVPLLGLLSMNEFMRHDVRRSLWLRSRQSLEFALEP
jgi:hypothetical protein